jgi:hypothetical protein
MIYKNTKENNETSRRIIREVGKQIYPSKEESILIIVKNQVKKVSEDLNLFNNESNNLVYASIELRQKGIIIHFLKNDQNIQSWIIPYYRLIMNKKEDITIFEGKSFLKFKLPSFNSKKYKFIDLLLRKKSQYSRNFEPAEELIF